MNWSAPDCFGAGQIMSITASLLVEKVKLAGLWVPVVQVSYTYQIPGQANHVIINGEVSLCSGK